MAESNTGIGQLKNNTHEKYTDAYIDILNTYKNQIETSISQKTTLKNKFFKTIKWIMYIILLLFILSILISFVIFYNMIIKDYQSVAVITGAITALVSSFVTMIITIFKLPKIIAEYLFNKKEDKLMNEIIKNIQTYEINAINLENVAEIDATNKSITTSQTELTMEYSPNTNSVQPHSEQPTDETA